ncbi:MAG: bifunctional DNA primase/polymerase [Acidimicrobiales bacterium]
MSTNSIPTPCDTDARAFAHRYAEHGLRVIRISRTSKKAIDEGWPKLATVDHDTIDRTWKTDWYGIAITMGLQPDGRFVVALDIDDKEGKRGFDDLHDLERLYGALPEQTPTQTTPSGGEHRLYEVPGGVEIHNSAGKIADGLDIRGHHGYIAAEGTVLANGRYEWVDGLAPWECDIAPLPPAWVDLLTAVPDKPQDRPPAYVGDPRPGDRWAEVTPWPQILTGTFAGCAELERETGIKVPAARYDSTTRDGVERWLRPGAKSERGHDATLYHKGSDILWPFSPNWPGLKANRSYSRFGYFAAVWFGDDHIAAASWLARQGFGSPLDDGADLVDGLFDNPIDLADEVIDADLDLGDLDDLIGEVTSPSELTPVVTPDPEPLLGDPTPVLSTGNEVEAPPTPPPSSHPASAEGSGAFLPESFWNTTPILRHISDAARANKAPRDGTLAVVLARVTYLTPPDVVPPTTVSRTGTLNQAFLLLGPSGSGKGKSITTGTDLLREPPRTDERYLHTKIAAGSGEGISATFRAFEEVDGVKGVPVWRNHGVLQQIAEGEEALKVGGRSGATFWTQARQAWSGEDLGFANATKDHTRPIVPEQQYRWVLVVGFQPATVAPLLEDAAGGTPQRMVWLQAVRPPAQGDLPPHPGPLRWQVPDWECGLDGEWVDVYGQQRRAMTIDAEAAEDLVRLDDAEGGPLDGHAGYVQLKLSCSIALLHGRLHVTNLDWELAGVIMENSNGVRAIAEGHSAAEAKARSRAKQMTHVETAVLTDMARRAQEDKRIAGIENQILDGLSKMGRCSRSQLKNGRIRTADRRDADSIIDDLIERGMVMSAGAQIWLAPDTETDGTVV